MASRPLISVLLPAKNCGPHLKEAVGSLLSQTCRAFELIIVNDGSTDGSVESLDTSDPRVGVIDNAGAGIVDALNTGARAASGEFLARMDGDDVCHPERFERQIEYFNKHPSTGVAGSLVEVFAHGGAAEGYRLYEAWVNSLVSPEDIRREIFIESPLPHPSVMMRADLFHRLGGYRDRGWPEDYDLWLRALEAGAVMGKAPYTLLRWRDTDRRYSKRDERYSRLNFMRARAHFLARTILKNEPAPVIWGAGKTGGLLSRLLGKEGVDTHGFIDIHPRKIGGRKADRPVRAPEAVTTFNGRPLLVAVAARGARETIRCFLNSAGKTEGADYYCVI